MRFHTFADVTAHLDRLGLFHMDFGLDRMRGALGRMHLQESGIGCPVVQIVGTNGKGSTAVFLAELLKKHGLRAGLYTSPHLVNVRERIWVDGEMLPENHWPELASAVYEAEPGLTYFEFLTVLAVAAFRRAGVECMVLEAGLGGRHDATTAVRADMVCFTPIALDHMAVLGPDIRAVATDKAGAMRAGKPAVTAVQDPTALTCLEQAARALGSDLIQAPACPGLQGGTPSLGLRGPHQYGNAALALTAWRLLAERTGWKTDAGAEALALSDAFIPGRLQRIAATAPGDSHIPPLLLDGSHNPHGLSALAEALRQLPAHPAAIVFSCMADKDMDAMLPLVRGMAREYGAPVFVPGIPGNPRAADARALADRIGGATAVVTLADALRTAAASGLVQAERPVLVCGSLYLLGEFFAAHPEYLDR